MVFGSVHGLWVLCLVHGLCAWFMVSSHGWWFWLFLCMVLVSVHGL
jgi:hypothetical protein